LLLGRAGFPSIRSCVFRIKPTNQPTNQPTNPKTKQDGGNVVTFAERVVTTFNGKMSKGREDDKITMINPAWHDVVSVYVLRALFSARQAPVHPSTRESEKECVHAPPPSCIMLTAPPFHFPSHPHTHTHTSSYRSETGLSKGSGSLILQKMGRAFQTTFMPTGAIDALQTGLHDVRVPLHCFTSRDQNRPTPMRPGRGGGNGKARGSHLMDEWMSHHLTRPPAHPPTETTHKQTSKQANKQTNKQTN
jgi:hypothetical protein